MKNGILIPLDRPGRILKKARAYVMDLEALLSNTSVAVSVLLEALPYADADLMLKIIPLLGCTGKDRVLWPLYHLTIDPSKDEQVHRLAALQLGLAASLSDDPSALKFELIENLNHPEPAVRGSSALALGWEGNWSAVESLVAHLSDPDRDVQAAVVAALSSIGDDRVFDLLTTCLENGTVEQQSSILLNLWRFAERFSKVEEMYLGRVKTLSTGLRLDALSGLAMIPLSSAILDVYRCLLADEDPRIRIQIIENLSVEDPADEDQLRDILILLLADKDIRVRQAAIRLFSRK